MADVKDKVVTVESLSILHEHNKDTYMPMVDPIGSGIMTMNGDGNFSGDVNTNSLTINSEVQLVPMGDGLKFVFNSGGSEAVAETYVNATSLSAIHYWTRTNSTGTGNSSSVVVSADSSAFPKNGEQDGFTYIYQGTLDSISTEPVIKAITITENGRYTAPSGVDGYSPITVNVNVESNIEADSLSNVHYWTKSVTNDDILETEVTNVVLSNYSSLGTGNSWDSVDYADEIEIVSGVLSLINPTTITLSSSNKSEIIGKYIYSNLRGKYYRLPSQTLQYNSSTYTADITAELAYELTAVVGGEDSLVVISSNRSAYPDNGEQNGYIYVYQGALDAG